LVFIGQDLGAVGGLDDYHEGYCDSFNTPAGVTVYFGLGGEDGAAVSGLYEVANWGSGDCSANKYVTNSRFDNCMIAVGFSIVGIEQRIVEGKMNAGLDKVGQWIKQQSPRPIFLRIGYEFDGFDWNHYVPETYVPAFRYVKDYLDAMGIDNVAYVWQSKGYGISLKDYDKWYPGDKYVDWCGFSRFDIFDGNMIRFARAKGKPVFIAESTPTLKEKGKYVDSDIKKTEIAAKMWKDWFIPFFRMIEENADVIKAFSYINVDWYAQPMWKNDKIFQQCDTRIQKSEYISEKWQEKMAESRYVNAQSLSYILDMVHHNPGEPLYDTRYNNPAIIKEMGYNGKVFFLFDSPTLAINWDKLDKDILPAGSPDREWVNAKANRLDSLFNECKSNGLKVYCMSDLMLFPVKLIEKQGIGNTFGDINAPGIENLLRFQLREMFNQFPQLDGIVVRIGETYLHDAPYHKGSIKNKGDAEKTIIPLMNILRDEVCEKLNKKVIFRTWYSFDVDLATYLKISDTVEPHPNLTIAVKHCEGDFHRGNPFSKVIGQGRHKQVIEVQCAREYEGKGAYPNYVAQGVIDGFSEHKSMCESGYCSLRDALNSKLIDGVWTWTRGGGWEGPYIGTNELWCDLNAYVMAQWANNTSQTEEEVFYSYAKKVLGLNDDHAKLFRKLSLLSGEAVLLGRRSAMYFEDIGTWWTRDEYIGVPSLPQEKEKIEVILREKDKAIEIWQEIVALSDKINFKDNKNAEFVKVSSSYGLHLYRIYRALFYLSAYEKDTNIEKDKWIAEYDAAWKDYALLPVLYGDICPTLYKKNIIRRSNRIKLADDMVNSLRELLK
jgi:hypothetical protein